MVFFISMLIVVADQLTKMQMINLLKNSRPHVIVPDFFRLVYVENYGAAFGILQNKRWIFIVITLIVILVISLFIVKNYSKLNIFMKLSLCFLLGGAIGNFIDRVRFGYVVDFLSFRLFNIYEFPVFNLADIFIVIGTGIILVLVLFDKYLK